MSDPGDGGVIIIKGGSVELDYDETIYARDPLDPKKHINRTGKITRVEISGDITYDSGEFKDGLRCTITTTCE
jgi:hypothetical protein